MKIYGYSYIIVKDRIIDAKLSSQRYSPLNGGGGMKSYISIREAAEGMAAGPQRDIALAEYHYFSGQPEAAAKEAEPHTQLQRTYHQETVH